MKKARYVFDRDVFDRNVTRLRDAFMKNDICVTLGYSVKTNPHEAVLRSARANGMYAEVVSPHEYELAVRCGFPSHMIIYNGIIPDPDGKVEVAMSGGIVNVESLHELLQIDDLARQIGKAVNVGIRICPNVPNGLQSRFGVRYLSGEYLSMTEIARESEYVNIEGVHCHMTSARDLGRWEKKVRQMALIAMDVGAKYIDLGSNFYGPMDPRMESQFEGPVPDFEKYAELIADTMKEVYGKKPKHLWPKIILEPGTPVVANAVSIEAEVMNVRNVNGRNIATVNCSMYDCGFAYISKQIPLDVVHLSVGEEYEKIDICGNTCVEIDRLHKDYSGMIAIGDKVIFRNLGAYSVSLSSWFIEPPLDFVVKEKKE